MYRNVWEVTKHLRKYVEDEASFLEEAERTLGWRPVLHANKEDFYIRFYFDFSREDSFMDVVYEGQPRFSFEKWLFWGEWEKVLEFKGGNHGMD